MSKQTPWYQDPERYVVLASGGPEIREEFERRRLVASAAAVLEELGEPEPERPQPFVSRWSPPSSLPLR